MIVATPSPLLVLRLGRTQSPAVHAVEPQRLVTPILRNGWVQEQMAIVV